MYKHDSREFDVRISEKIILTIFEAAALTGIGTKKLAKLADAELSYENPEDYSRISKIFNVEINV